MATYVNDLRLKEIATGDEAGTWGTSTNTNLELIAEAFSYGTEASFGSDADATTTIADGSTDPARSLYLKVTSGASLTATRTLTIAPNTVSKVWIIENATSGSQSINISQGSGANVTIPSGKTKIVYSDGAGSGAAVVDALASLNLETSGIIETSSSIQTPLIEYTDGDDAMTIADGGQVTFAQNIIGTLGTAAQPNITSLGTLTTLTVDDITINGSTISDSGSLTIDVGTDLTLDADSGNIFLKDGGTHFATLQNNSSDLRIVSIVQDKDLILRGNDGGSYINALTLDMSAAGAATFNSTVTASGTSVFASLDISGDIDVDGTTNLDVVDIDGAVDMASTLTLAGNADFNGDLDVDGTTNLDVVDIDGAVDMASTLTVGSLLTVNDGAIFNEGSADKDFRVESNGQTHALFVDGGLDNVGIGYSAAHTATNKGLVILTGGGTGGIQLNREDGSYPSDGESLGSLAWKGQDSPNTNAAAEASIEAVAQENMSGSTAATDLVFNTKNTGTGPGSAPTERLRLKRDGDLYLGGTASGGTPSLFFFNNDSPRAFLKASGTGFIIDSDSTITFQPNNTAKMILASSGALGLGTTPKLDQHTGWSTFYVGEKASLFSENDTGTHGIDGTFLTDNLYIDSDTGSYAAIETNESSAYRQEAGIHHWYSQGSASGGAAVTLSERMRLNTSGELNIGTTGAASGNHKLVVESASTTGTVNSHIALIGDSATNGQGPQILFSEAGDGQAYAGGTIGFTRTGSNSIGDLVFGTRGSSGDASTTTTERMRIDSSGNVGIGTDSPQSGIHLAEGGAGNDGGSVLTLSQTGFGSIVNNDDLASIHFGGVTSGGVGSHACAKIMVEGDGTFASADFPTRMTFHTTEDGTDTLTERIRITNNGNFILQDGCPIQGGEDGRAGGVTVGTSFVTILDFSGLGAANKSRGFYLVTVVREGASVGTSITLQVGVSSSGLAIIYDTIQANGLSAQASNAQIQVKQPSGGDVICHATAIPMSIQGSDQ